MDSVSKDLLPIIVHSCPCSCELFYFFPTLLFLVLGRDPGTGQASLHPDPAPGRF